MQTTVTLNERPVRIDISAAAQRAAAQHLTQTGSPLGVEMELLFSCLIRKQVRFVDETRDGDVSVAPGLSVRFRPVMTRVCRVDEGGTAPPLTDFPIANPRAYVPHWLKIDYRGGVWSGEFGYR